MKRIYTGIESSGKTLRLARVVEDLVKRNYAWHKKTGIIRPIFSNIKFSERFEVWCSEIKRIPIHYWSDTIDLIAIKEADVIIDEVGNYFDSRSWEDLTLDVRRWLTQGAKMGVEIYGSAQDFAQVDKAFRRLINELYEIKKIIGSPRPAATRPPIKFIWGICLVNHLDPNGYDEDKKVFARFGLPGFFTIKRKYCDIFNTNEEIAVSKLSPYRHLERYCDTCKYHHVIHR